MKYYVVDAFADKLFEGNPAGICIINNWLTDELMQQIASENNLSETAFAVKENNGAYHLRWFTPGGEVNLCGHATLATTFVLANFIEPAEREFRFTTLSGNLTVKRVDDLYEMDFPKYELTPVPVTDEMEKAIGCRPVEAWMGRDLVCVLSTEEQIKNANPDETIQKNIEGLLLHITARSSSYDCISRSFAPKLNIREDPVCGSGHCHIAPLWAAKLGKSKLIARQASKRGGTLYVEVCKDRVKLSGKAVLYSIAELYIS